MNTEQTSELKNAPAEPAKQVRSGAWLGGATEPEPMSEADVRLAIAIRRILKRFGSLAAFYEHLEAERTRKNRELCDEQWRRINEAA